jgi:hypothetical protein
MCGSDKWFFKECFVYMKQNLFLQHMKVNVKSSLCLTNEVLCHKGIWGGGCIDPHFLDLGTGWKCVVSFTPQPFYTRGKSPRYPLDRRLGGPQRRSARCAEEKILDPTRTRTLTPWLSSPYPVAIPTMLYTVSRYSIKCNVHSEQDSLPVYELSFKKKKSSAIRREYITKRIL